MLKQRTLKNLIRATGVGLHSGEKIYLTLRPAPIDTGIIFCRVDCEPIIEIPALATHVGATMMNTTLGQGQSSISTVEHLLSAIAGLGLDNVYIDVSGPELPIMDGSAGPFVFLLQSAGVQEQNAAKKFIRIKKKVAVKVDDKQAEVIPFEGFKVDFTIDFDHPLLQETQQREVVDFGYTSYVKEISRARTFGFLSEYEWLKSNNLAKGGSLDNAIVLDEFKILNDTGLRYKNEFVRHKVLDAIGDLYLLGHAMIGAYTGFKSGHDLNNQLARAILADEKAWEIVNFPDIESSPVRYFQPAFPIAII